MAAAAGVLRSLERTCGRGTQQDGRRVRFGGIADEVRGLRRRHGVSELPRFLLPKSVDHYATFHNGNFNVSSNNTNTKLGQASNLWVGPLRTAMPQSASKQAQACVFCLPSLRACLHRVLHEKLFKQGSTATVDSYLKPSGGPVISYPAMPVA